MASAVQTILDQWRHAERVLADLPASAPERRIVEGDVELLRATYQRLTASTIPRSEERLYASLLQAELAWGRLEELHARYAEAAAVIASRRETTLG